MNNHQKDRNLLLKNKHHFEKLLKEIDTEIDVENLISKINNAVNFAINQYTGYYSSSIIENKLIEISSRYNIDNLSNEFIQDSFLHVTTSVHNIGGHSRVLERWIKNAPNDQKHSVIVLDQKNPTQMPEVLNRNITEKNGDLIVLNKDLDHITKALELRKIANKYQYIVLHIHMHDIVPTIAFGNPEFKRPIIFFNHAEHLFWVGISISDIIADFREFSKEFSLKRRKVVKSEILPIPIDKNFIKLDQSECKEKLNIPKNTKVIVSIANEYKYNPFDEYDFVEFAINLLKSTENAVFYVIGPKPEAKYWADAIKKSNNRIVPLGIVHFNEINKYICAADLYIESFPFPSFTALLDVARLNIPVVSLITPISHLDSILKVGITSENQNELLLKSKNILNKSISQNEVIDELRNDHYEEGWLKHLERLISQTPLTHRIHIFDNSNLDDSIIDDYDIFLNKMAKTQIKAENKNKLFFKILIMLIPFKKLRSKLRAKYRI